MMKLRGHYDILYPVVQVNLMPTMSAYRSIQRTPMGLMGPTGAGDFAAILQHIPGLSLAPVGVDSGFETLGGGGSGASEVPLPSPDPTMASPHSFAGATIPAGAAAVNQHSPIASVPTAMMPSPVLPFRHSKYQLEADLQQPSTPTQPYQTSSFKK